MNNKELEKELEILTAPMESTLSMAEQMNNKNNYEKKVDSLCIESDRLLQESDFDAALFKLIEAYKIISDHPWGIKQRQVYDLIQNAQFKRQNNIKKEELKIQQQREKEIEEKEQQTLIQSHKKELEREHQERENKLKQLQEKKKEEDRISNAAFQLLEEGQVFHKNQQYDELIAKYRQAKNLFLDIKWNTEAEKVENTIQNFIKEKNLALLKDEKEKKSLQEQESTWKAKELELNAQSKKLKELEEKKKLIIQQSLSRKELENQVYADLDKASLYEKSNDLVRALELYGNIKDVMARLGWKQEIIKLNDTIKILENKIWEEQERQKRDLLAKRLKEEEDLEIARRIKEQEVESKNREEQKRKKLEILEKSKQQEKEASEQAFKQIEDIEKEVKFYKEHAIIDKFSLECPYLRAKETYQNSKEILHKIGWKGEASKLDSAISMYEKLYADDQKERVLYNKKREQEIEEQRKLEESIKFQKKEQERREQEKRQKLE
ncbi:MAG: hypothetical protein JW776_00005, partial [Candidatus Lokiarchaeota archaeon]|nr:hypothetical protein [Candidatus Lokiarchaeota archaeon]